MLLLLFKQNWACYSPATSIQSVRIYPVPLVLFLKVLAPSISKYLQLYYSVTRTRTRTYTHKLILLHSHLVLHTALSMKIPNTSATTVSSICVRSYVYVNIGMYLCIDTYTHTYIHTYTHKNSKYFRNLPEKCAEECAANLVCVFYSGLLWYCCCWWWRWGCCLCRPPPTFHCDPLEP